MKLIRTLFKILFRRKTPKRFDSIVEWEIVPFSFEIDWFERLDGTLGSPTLQGTKMRSIH